VEVADARKKRKKGEKNIKLVINKTNIPEMRRLVYSSAKH